MAVSLLAVIKSFTVLHHCTVLFSDHSIDPRQTRNLLIHWKLGFGLGSASALNFLGLEKKNSLGSQQHHFSIRWLYCGQCCAKVKNKPYSLYFCISPVNFFRNFENSNSCYARFSILEENLQSLKILIKIVNLCLWNTQLLLSFTSLVCATRQKLQLALDSRQGRTAALSSQHTQEPPWWWVPSMAGWKKHWSPRACELLNCMRS